MFSTLQSRLNKAVSASRDSFASLQGSSVLGSFRGAATGTPPPGSSTASSSSSTNGSSSNPHSAFATPRHSAVDLLEPPDGLIDPDLLIQPSPARSSISTTANSSNNNTPQLQNPPVSTLLAGASAFTSGFLKGRPPAGSRDTASDKPDAPLFSLDDDDGQHEALLKDSGDESPGALQVSAELVSIVVSGEAMDISKEDLGDRLTRLRRFESKYPELAQAYQSVHQRITAIDSVVRQNTSIVADLRSTSGVDALALHLSESKAKAKDLSDEVGKLRRQLAELKEVQQLETASKAEMFQSMQAQLAAKDELRSSSSEMPPTATLIPIGSLTDSHDHDNNIITVKLKLKELQHSLRAITAERDQALARNRELSIQLSGQSSTKSLASPSDVLPGNLITVARLQSELDQAKSKLQDESARSRDLEVELRKVQTLLSEARENSKPTSSNSIIPRGIRQALRSASEGAGGIASLIPTAGTSLFTSPSSTAGALPVTNQEPSSLFDVSENGAELSSAEATMLEQLEELAQLKTDYAEASRLNSEMQSRIRLLETEVMKKSDELRIAQESLESLKISSSRALEDATAAHIAGMNSLDLEIRELKAKMEASTVPKSEEASEADPDSIGTVESLKQKNAALEARAEDLQKRAETAAAAARKAGEAAATKVIEMQAVVRDAVGKQQEAEARAEKADGILAETLSKLAAAETGRQENAKALKQAEEDAAAAAEKVKAAEEAKTEALAKMDKAYSIIRKTKQEFEAKVKELDSAKLSLEEMTKNLEEVDKKWVEKYNALNDDLESKSAEASALTSTLELLKSQMRVVALQRDASREELSELKREVESLHSGATSPLRVPAGGKEPLSRSSLESRLRVVFAEEAQFTDDLPASDETSESQTSIPPPGSGNPTDGHEAEAKRQLGAPQSEVTSDQLPAVAESGVGDPHSFDNVDLPSEAVPTVELRSSFDLPPQDGVDSQPDDVDALKAALRREAVKLQALKTQLATLSNRVKAAELEAAQAKSQVVQKDREIASREETLVALRKQVAEEEEKKNKSIQLLRNTKARILKLEETLQTRDSEIAAARAELDQNRASAAATLRDREIQMTSLTRQVEDMALRLRSQKEEVVELERRRGERDAEYEALNWKLQDLNVQHTALKTERDSLRDQDEKRRAELESIRSLLATQASQLAVWPARSAELEQRIATLDGELETSKRLFETKSIEAEALKFKVSELERSMYETEVSAGTQAGDLEALRRDIDRLKKELAAALKDLRTKEGVATDLSKRLEAASSSLHDKESHIAQLSNDAAALREQLVQVQKNAEAERKQLELEEAAWKQRIAVSERSKREAVEKLKEKELLFQETSQRETQLAKLNKTLKDEVRKLSRAVGVPTPVTTPPVTSRPSVIDERDLVAANAGAAPSSSGLSSSSSSSSSALQQQQPHPSFAPAIPSSLALSLSNSSSSSSFPSSSPPASPSTSSFPSSSSSAPTAVGSSTAAAVANHYGSRAPSLSSERPGSPTRSEARWAGSPPIGDQELSLEYLRNVFVKFVESNKTKKSQMMPALAMLLKLSPEESRRIQRHL
ncbi:hypothetical protein DFJ73DRAFT_934418 [Zopfochytrium polystomum]|nr:hypothetical protein DFJ73DRAFT_934418 [Zopfochytrium polystomum]